MTTASTGKPFTFPESVSEFFAKPEPSALVSRLQEIDKTITRTPIINTRMNADGTPLTPELRFTKYGFNSACSRIGIPAKLMSDFSAVNPKLASVMFNQALRINGDDLLAVTRNGMVEGVVSTGYSRFSNVQAVETMAKQADAGSLASASLNGLRMRLNTVHTRFTKEAQRGDLLNGGVSIRNSEDGRWAFEVQGYILRLICTNGMTRPVAGTAGRIQHRGTSIALRATSLIEQAGLTVDKDFSLITRALETTLTDDEIIGFQDRIGDKFNRVVAGNVTKHAWEEAKKFNRTPTLYDEWNGVTWQAHSAKTVEREQELQEYASTVLDWHKPSVN